MSQIATSSRSPAVIFNRRYGVIHRMLPFVPSKVRFQPRRALSTRRERNLLLNGSYSVRERPHRRFRWSARRTKGNRRNSSSVRACKLNSRQHYSEDEAESPLDSRDEGW